MYVWKGEGVLQEYTSGLVCVLARSVGEAREIALQHLDVEYLDPNTDFLDEAPEILIEPGAASVCGGG